MPQPNARLVEALKAVQALSGTRPRRVGAGLMVYAAEDPAQELFLVADGVVEISRPLTDGAPLRGGLLRGTARQAVRVIKLGWVGRDGMVGELEFHDRRSGRTTSYPKRHFNARAITEVKLLALPYAALLDALPQYPVIEEGLRRHVVAWLDEVAEAAGVTRFQPTTIRLARVLRDLAMASAAPAPTALAQRNVVVIENQLPQDEIGVAIGDTRETVSKEMKKFERAGILRNGENQTLIITDFRRLGQIAELGAALRRDTHDDRRDRIDHMLDSGDNYRARNMALQLVEHAYPLSPELQYRACLASARAGGTEEAMRLVARFGFEGDPAQIEAKVRAGFANPLARKSRRCDEAADEEDVEPEEGWDDDAMPPRDQEHGRRLEQLVEDASVIAARLAKDSAFARPPGPARKQFLEQAKSGYLAAYERTQGHFSGINAAAMAALLGEKDEVRRIATSVRRRLPAQLETYWQAATVAEASALLGRTEEARAAMAVATAMPDATPGRRASTRRQLAGLRGAVADETLDTLLEALPVPTPIAYSGHLMLGERMDLAAQEAAAQEVVPRLEAALRAAHVGSAYGALAAGSDILIAEAVLRLGGALHVVLPTRFADFIEASVTPGDPADEPGHWRRRFDHCLAAAATVTILHGGPVGVSERDALFQAGFRMAAGLALLQADETTTRAAMVAVHDGGPIGSIAGTAMAIRAWQATSEALHVLPCPWRRPGKGAEDATAGTPFRPVVFVWAEPERAGKAAKAAAAAERLERAVTALLGDAARVVRKPTQECVVAVLCDNVPQAAGLASQLTGGLGAGFAEPRVVCDFGLVLDPQGRPSPPRIARLRGAEDMPDIPAGRVTATEVFVAEARLNPAFAHRLQPMGRVGTAAAGQANGLPLPSVRMFQVTPADGELALRYPAATVR